MNARHFLLLGACLAAPALGQHEHGAAQAPADAHAGHDPAAAQAPADVHAGHGPAAAQAPADVHAAHDPDAAQAPADAHAGHAPGAAADEPADPHAGHEAAGEPADAHAGHAPGAAADEPADPHAGHDMRGTPAAEETPAAGEPPPEAFSGPEHAADALFGSTAMASSRELLLAEHGDITTLWLMADRLEMRRDGGANRYVWDMQGWYGGDVDKLWVKTEGEGASGDSPDTSELQLLWSRAIHPWFDVQAGLRHDFRPGPERTHLVLGVQGLMPYRFEVDAAAFVSDDGDVSARLEGEYDLWLTQRMILQPRAEVELAARAVPELGIGSGLNSGEIGLRLRYQVRREFAPYVGVEYERTFGDTADFARMAGEERGGWNAVLGIQAWF